MASPIRDDFHTLSPHWVRLAVGCAECFQDGTLHLVVDGAVAGSLSVAQIDDYNARPRSTLLWTPPVRLEARVRFSHAGTGLMGTAGLGFWNVPTYLSSTRFEFAPNWAWFYYASPHSTLSMTNGPAHGWKAAAVRGGESSPLTMAVVDQLTHVPRIGRLLSHMHMPADEAALPAEEMPAWHTYAVEWKPDGVVFSMDGNPVLSSRLALPGRMAAVAWVDNNFASFGPDGGIVMGNLDVPQRQWMEIEYLAVEPLP